MRGIPQADIALGGLLNGSLAAMRAKTHAIKTQLNAASLTIKARRPLRCFAGTSTSPGACSRAKCLQHMHMPNPMSAARRCSRRSSRWTAS